MSFLSDFTLSAETGFAGITKFQFDSNVYDTTVYRAVWYFGDGTSSQQLQTTHVYQSPGTYTVKLLIFNRTANKEDYTWPVTVEKNIKITLYLNHSVRFDTVPPPTFAGHYNRHPFRLLITAPDTVDHHIYLGCQFSRSDQVLEVPSKWSFLRPQWKFLDLKGNVIQKIKTTDTIITTNQEGAIDPNGTFVAGVTGYADFYFIDDIYNSDLAVKNEPYSTIIATLDTLDSKDYFFQTDSEKFLPSFANSSATTTCPHIFLWRTPTALKITENGIRPHTNPRWSNSTIPIIVNSICPEEFKEDFPEGMGVKVAHPESFFVRNFPLTNTENINVNLSLSGNLSASFYPPPVLEWTDSSYYKTPGYYKGSFDVPSVDAFNVTVDANISFLTPALSCNYYNPILWISNPENGSLTIAHHYHHKGLKDVFSLSAISVVSNIDMPTSSSGILGSHGIYNIAACPLPGYQAWMIDSDSQKLYRVSSIGHILCSIDINQLVQENLLGFPPSEKVTPFSLVLDGNREMWITLKDTISTIKLDRYGNFLTAVTPFASGSYLDSIDLPFLSNLTLNNQDLSWFDQSTYFPESSALDYAFLIQPSYVETDINNNLYVSYTNPFSSFIVKYDPQGVVSYIKSQSYSNGLVPTEMVSDKEGNLWVSSSVSRSLYAGYIEKLTPEGNLFETYTLSLNNLSLLDLTNTGVARFGPYNNINYMTLDVDQNLWFTYGYRNVGKIFPITSISGQVTSVYFGVSSVELFDHQSFINGDDYALEGICSDYSGKVYVVNSVENRIYVVNKDSMAIEDVFWINPQGFVYYLDKNNNPVREYNKYNKSAMAAGDWSGFEWINKYGSNSLPEFSKEETFITLNGSTRPLNFYKDNSHNNFFKINENYDLANVLKEHAFTPRLQESENLFDNFFANIFGKYPFNPLDPGVEMYEKIANFVNNHNDIDNCNIDQLYSNAAMVDLNTDDFRLNYPPSIKRLMDLVSVNLTRLRGSSDENILNASHRGSQITSLSYIVTAGTPVILGTKSSYDPYRLIYTGPINNAGFYSLDTLAEYIGLKMPWNINYEFFHYAPTLEKTYMDGVIDWNNPQTTIQFNNSAVNVWNGDEGIFETVFAYELYKGLNLLNS